MIDGLAFPFSWLDAKISSVDAREDGGEEIHCRTWVAFIPSSLDSRCTVYSNYVQSRVAWTESTPWIFFLLNQNDPTGM